MSDSPIFDGLLRDHCYTSLDELTKWETPEFCWGPRFTISLDKQCADTSHPVIEVPEAVQQTIKHYEERYNKMAGDMLVRLAEQNKTPSVDETFSMELPKAALPRRKGGLSLIKAVTPVEPKPQFPDIISVETLGGEQLWARGYQS